MCILGGHRAQSERFGTKIFSETVTKVDLAVRPFKVYTAEKEARGRAARLLRLRLLVLTVGAVACAPGDGGHGDPRHRRGCEAPRGPRLG